MSDIRKVLPYIRVGASVGASFTAISAVAHNIRGGLPPSSEFADGIVALDFMADLTRAEREAFVRELGHGVALIGRVWLGVALAMVCGVALTGLWWCGAIAALGAVQSHGCALLGGAFVEAADAIGRPEGPPKAGGP